LSTTTPCGELGDTWNSRDWDASSFKRKFIEAINFDYMC
jgi:hypothetical protein